MTNTLTVFGILMFTTGTGKALEALDNYETHTFTMALGDGALQTLPVSFRGQLTKLKFEGRQLRSATPPICKRRPQKSLQKRPRGWLVHSNQA